MLRRIELHGILAEKFGKSFELDVSSPREACTALGYQVDGFKNFMMTAHESGLFLPYTTMMKISGQMKSTTPRARLLSALFPRLAALSLV